jgi:hypothetical protein
LQPNSENTTELEAFEVQMYANTQVLILNQWPVSNKAVYDNGNELWHNNNQVFTNTVGIAQFQLNQLGDHIISAAGEEIKNSCKSGYRLRGIIRPTNWCLSKSCLRRLSEYLFR